MLRSLASIPIYLFLLSLAPLVARAGLYGEHKMMGDGGFERFLDADSARRAFFRTELGMRTITQPQISEGLTAIVMKTGNFGPYGLTYGDITGIAGDHTRDPIEIYYGILPLSLALFEVRDAGCNALFDTSRIPLLQSRLVQAVQVHHNAMLLGAKAGGNFDFGLYYLLLSYEDESHFHYVGTTSAEELADLTAELRKLFVDYRACLFSNRERLIDDLNGVNVSAKYALLHCAALEMMHIAGNLWAADEKELAKTFIMKAIIYNGFADHYLQDAFASGHLVVRRSALHAFDDNGAHDYYGRVGIGVKNMRGDSWHSLGDGYIEYGEDTYNYASEAVAVSLGELWTEFDETRKGADRPSPLDVLVGLPDAEVGRRLVNDYAIFKIIPLEISKDRVTLGNSRGGTFFSITAGAREKFVTPGFIGGAIGFGFKAAVPARDVISRESDLVMGATLGYRNGSLNVTSDAEKWWELRFGLESTLYDGWQIGIDNGLRYQEEVARWLFNPHIGWELKPISWSFAPSIHLNYQIVAKRKPTAFLQFQLRYY